MEKARAIGINVRIVPGIIPITNAKQVKRFAELSGAEIPEELLERIDSCQDDAAKVYQVGVDFAIQQCKELLEKGSPGLHFYTLNKSRATIEVFETLRNQKLL